MTDEQIAEAAFHVKWLLAEAFSTLDELCERAPLEKFPEFSKLRKKLIPILEELDK